MSLIATLLQTPHTFAVVGVSQDPTEYGYEVFDALTRQGHRVLPINPKYEAIDGQPCYPSLPVRRKLRMLSSLPRSTSADKAV